MQPTRLSDNDRVVLTALSGCGRPLSAYDILQETRSSSLRAPTQVYRALQKLERQGLVHRIEALSAFVACSDGHGEDHRPGFVICRDCGTVREFENNAISEIARKVAGAEFSIDVISLEIFGRCTSCTTAVQGC